MRLIVRCAALAGVAVATALVLAPAAFAHARVSPAVSLAGKLQLYGLAVPTEKENLTTTRVVLTVPQGFGNRLVRARARLDAAAPADRLG